MASDRIQYAYKTTRAALWESLGTPPAVILVSSLLLSLYLTGSYSYLLFHSSVEVFTIAVAWSVFFLAWNSRRFLANHYLLLIGIASLFVGVIDAFHTLAYKGMNVFSNGGTDLATQLWVAGRYVQSLSFLVAPWFLRRKLNPALTVVIYAGIVAAVLESIFQVRIFPVCYVEGLGLTSFKTISEYVVTLIFFASTLLLFRHRGEFDNSVFTQLTVSMFLMMAAELSFSSYVNVYGAANLAGHLLRFLAFLFIYRAIVVTGLIRPMDLLFRDLRHRGDALRQSNEQLGASVAALARSTEDLMRSNEDLRYFAYAAGHDLKEPLRTISGCARLLADDTRGKLDADAETLLGYVQDGARRMDRLIHDLLQYAKVASEAKPLVRTDANDVLSWALMNLHAGIEQAGAQITSDRLPAVSATEQLVEVFQNLIGNAVKYRADGRTPEIQISAKPDGGKWVFAVSDNGIGIDMAYAEQIFKPFHRLHGRDEYEGSGIGLAICKRVIERLGGAIWVESELGKGSTFYFTLRGENDL